MDRWVPSSRARCHYTLKNKIARAGTSWGYCLVSLKADQSQNSTLRHRVNWQDYSLKYFPVALWSLRKNQSHEGCIEELAHISGCQLRLPERSPLRGAMRDEVVQYPHIWLRIEVLDTIQRDHRKFWWFRNCWSSVGGSISIDVEGNSAWSLRDILPNLFIQVPSCPQVCAVSHEIVASIRCGAYPSFS